MRLHRLELTAYGPFAGTELVDFDHLNDAGLFLLSGATGAGKTSILDAVCFALYGTVPGVRGVKALKSQHSDEMQAPEVVLDFSVRERRFRVRRSPEWTRPKRRGTGLRQENAKASLTELTGGQEHFLSSRASEVGLMISDLVGLRAAQFQQVAMLPQGDFQRFLHATSQERHDVLQHLFHSDRFARIEDWVHDHSRGLGRRAEEAEERVQRLLHTIAERAGVEVGVSPDGSDARDVDEDPVSAVSDAEDVDEDGVRWAGSVLQHARARATELATDAEQCQARVTDARHRADEARRHAELARRAATARTVLDELASTEAEAERVQQRLDADLRAAGLRPLLDQLDDERHALEATAVARDRAATDLDAALGDACPEALRPAAALVTGSGTDDGAAEVDVPAVDAALEFTRSLGHRVEALLPRCRSLAAAEERVRVAESELIAARGHREAMVERRDELPDRLAAARTELDRIQALVSQREAVRLRLDAAGARRDAAVALPLAERTLEQSRDEHRARRDRAADARERVLDLQARRLAGIAAELAAGLRDGEACQVCGSTDHPEPAQPGVQAPVTAVEQDAAEQELAEAQRLLDVATAEVSAAEARVATLREAAQKLAACDAEEAVAALKKELVSVDAAAEALPQAEAVLASVGAELAEADAQVQDAERRVAAAEQLTASESAAVEQIRDEVAAALPGVGVAELPDLAEAVTSLVGVLTRARAALLQHEQTARRAAEVESRATQEADRAGFASLDLARAAVLTDDERTSLRAVVAERHARGAAARAVLADPEVEAAEVASTHEVTELDEVLQHLACAEARARDASSAAELAADRLSALEGLVERLQQAVATWRPLRDEHERASSMARLVRGQGGDNQLQMRLSAYVLATRLDQVVDAANERLGLMRDQRYLLQRTGKAHRKGSQAGLGLEVVDQWTGDTRDPATLSGGETFVVSLSLALGLADVVSQEAGGAEIETLFVDEGFGTLDPDTLDDVMDRLDGLRAGGRTVGVVSHVSELRTRIPVQVHVRKTPRGSTVDTELLVG